MRITIMLNVTDVPASSAWYQRPLGCRSGHGGPDFDMLMDGDALALMLHRRSADHHDSSPAPDERLGAGVSIYVRVDDIQAVAARAVSWILQSEDWWRTFEPT